MSIVSKKLLMSFGEYLTYGVSLSIIIFLGDFYSYNSHLTMLTAFLLTTAVKEVISPVIRSVKNKKLLKHEFETFPHKEGIYLVSSFFLGISGLFAGGLGTLFLLEALGYPAMHLL